MAMKRVVNHLSDSVSIVDVRDGKMRVVRTLLVGDEPCDIVFGGPQFNLAFVTTAHRGQNSPIDPQLTTPGIGRADVWMFDAEAQIRGEHAETLGGKPLTILSLFSDTPRALTHQIQLSGGGPSGLVLDEPHGIVYVLTRFNNAVTVVDTRTQTEIGSYAMTNPEPQEIVQGRKFFYDSTINDSMLRRKGARDGVETTFTCAPPGAGRQMAFGRGGIDDDDR